VGGWRRSSHRSFPRRRESSPRVAPTSPFMSAPVKKPGQATDRMRWMLACNAHVSQMRPLPSSALRSFYIFAEIFWPCATCPLPLGGEGGPPPAFSSARQPTGPGRGWWACARPFAVHIAPLKALGNDHATSRTFSRNLGTALRCLWFQAIDPLTPRPLSPKGQRGECRNSRAPTAALRSLTTCTRSGV
jgi:hypothetical protein